jgi:DNA repair exonuclease SbcCD ATPase subunit
MKEKERRREDHLARIEERLQRLEKRSEAGVAEMEKKAEVGLTEVKDKIKEVERRIEGAVQVESRVKELEDKVAEEKEKVEDKEQPGAAVVDLVINQIGKMRMKDSVKEMEGKVREAMCGVKVGNFNIGKETDDKVVIVRKVLEEVRKAGNKEEAGKLDRVLKRTRVVVLGKRTVKKKGWGGGPYSLSPSFYSARTGRMHRNWKGH